jgi:hypothetical protein
MLAFLVAAPNNGWIVPYGDVGSAHVQAVATTVSLTGLVVSLQIGLGIEILAGIGRVDLFLDNVALLLVCLSALHGIFLLQAGLFVGPASLVRIDTAEAVGVVAHIAFFRVLAFEFIGAGKAAEALRLPDARIIPKVGITGLARFEMLGRGHWRPPVPVSA